MPTLRLTKTAIDALIPGSKDTLYWDDRLSGFGLKFTPRGSAIYLVQYRLGGRGCPTRRLTIGKHGSPWTPAAAREEAERALREAAVGIDPSAARKQAVKPMTPTLSAQADLFLSQYGKRRWRSGTYSNAESNLRRWVLPTLGDISFDELRRPHVTQIFDAMPASSPALPRNVFALLRKLFSWAVERGDLERSPMDGMRSPPSVPSRDRVLSDEELRSIWLASHDLGGPFGAAIRLLMLTAQRRDEVARLDWSELDREACVWTLPASRTKNAREHTIPITSLFQREIDSLASTVTWPTRGVILTTNGKAPISDFSGAKSRLDMRAAIHHGRLLDAWRIHDLRRSAATGFQRLGVRFEVTEAVLNHVEGARSGVAGIYQRYGWSAEKRQALEAWGGHIANVIEHSNP